MNSNTKVIFADSDTTIGIRGYSIQEDRVSLHYDNPKENLNGFYIYEGDNLVFDGSDYIYRWDVVDQKPNTIYYTNNPGYCQTEPFQDLGDVPEPAEPLTNEELTEAVADLMYEVSMMQLGL